MSAQSYSQKRDGEAMRTHGGRPCSIRNGSIAIVLVVCWLAVSSQESSLLRLSRIYQGEAKFKSVPSVEPSVTDESTNSPLFHLVFTVDHFSTLNLRCIESIFFFHPTARLKIHSNAFVRIDDANDVSEYKMTPSRQRFAYSVQALDQLGYHIEIVPFSAALVLKRAVLMETSITSLVNATAANLWSSRLNSWKEQKFWYSNEANLLRLCLLYTEGGIYLDTDVILVRPLVAPIPSNDLETDGLSVDNAMARDGRSFHNAVMKFLQPGNLFLAAAITDFLLNYNGTVWGNNGPRVFRRTAVTHSSLICSDLDAPTKPSRSDASGNENACWLQPLPAEAFQPVPWRRWLDVCFDAKRSPVHEEASQIVKSPGVYAVHLNNHLIGETLEDQRYVPHSVCDYVLHSYCVLPCRDEIPPTKRRPE